MAHLHDSRGRLLGGLNTIPVATGLNRNYGPEETIPGLECRYGSFAYSYSHAPADNVQARSRRAGCHNPIETPDERHHCDACGGDYCAVHAEPAAHDCVDVILPLQAGPQYG